MQNHFELFHLPQRFALDMQMLDAAYREVQNQVHPDKFASAPDAERRVAMQWATRANEAYQTLKNPFRRAAYLCELHGVDLETESNTAMPREFLVQQMEWREALDEARDSGDLDALEDLADQLQATVKRQLVRIGGYLEGDDYENAAQGVRQLMFLEKFGNEVARVVDRLAD
ncbi:MAG: hscB [Paucimonas sp.]|nr:hscB [Paucimonas sp.]